MLFNFLLENPQAGILLLVSLIFALTLHEFGHAYVAYLCGDPTAKLLGRMNINPLSHLDPVGSLMLLFVGIGYAKPVPVDPRNFRYRNSDLYVSAAGPAMNLLLTLVGGILFNFLSSSGALTESIAQFLYLFMLINMSLCLFNLVPLGPLDGSYVLPYLLPRDIRHKYQQWNRQYGTQAIMGLLLLSFFLPSWSPFIWISRMSREVISIIL